MITTPGSAWVTPHQMGCLLGVTCAALQISVRSCRPDNYSVKKTRSPSQATTVCAPHLSLLLPGLHSDLTSSKDGTRTGEGTLRPTHTGTMGYPNLEKGQREKRDQEEREPQLRT